jgi:type II secretory pathway pseudopilin PulG
MNRFNQRGAINVLLIPLIALVVLFLGAAGFGIWAFTSRADYKNNSDKKSATAAAQAVQSTEVADAAKYAEEAKKPYDTYIGAAQFGNVTVNYPKTWSAYIPESERSSTPISGFFNPKIVPSVTDPNQTFALRVELSQITYETALDQFKGRVDKGQVTMAPYTLPKVPSVVGSRVEGQITNRKQGVMVILPIRNMTLRVWTESNDFKGDLDTHVLPNLSFVP